MTTNRTYQCNLCHVSLDERVGKLGYGVYFQNLGTSTLKLTPLREAENHVCRQCLRDLSDAWLEKQTENQK